MSPWTAPQHPWAAQLEQAGPEQSGPVQSGPVRADGSTPPVQPVAPAGESPTLPVGAPQTYPAPGAGHWPPATQGTWPPMPAPQGAWPPAAEGAWPVTQGAWPATQGAWPVGQEAWPPGAAGGAVAGPRRFGLGTLAAVALVAVVLGGGAGLAAGVAIHRSSGTAPAAADAAAPAASPSSAPGVGAPSLPPASVPPTPAAVAPGDGVALLAKLVPVPAGARALTVSGSTNGVMDLDQFVQREYPSNPLEQGILEARGFQVAAMRSWVGKDGVEVHVQAVQFADDDGAAGEILSQINAYDHDTTVSAHYSVPGASQGRGYEKQALDDAGNRRAILLAQDGPLALLIFFFTPGVFDRPTEAALLQRQLAALV